MSEPPSSVLSLLAQRKRWFCLQSLRMYTPLFLAQRASSTVFTFYCHNSNNKIIFFIGTLSTCAGFGTFFKAGDEDDFCLISSQEWTQWQIVNIGTSTRHTDAASARGKIKTSPLAFLDKEERNKEKEREDEWKMKEDVSFSAMLKLTYSFASSPLDSGGLFFHSARLGT